MKNPSKYIYQCCTHYREKGYNDGYIMLPIFRVKVCRNCGECHAVWGAAANILFMGLFRWFWDGKVHITTDRCRTGTGRKNTRID